MFNIFKKKQEKRFVSAVIAAGGSSTRMGGEDKLTIEIDGLPVLIHTIRAFEEAAVIDEIILVAKGEKIIEYADMVKAFELSKVTQVVAGGVSRLESVYKGVCAADPRAGYILVHDGARPLVTGEVIERVADACFESSCAAPAVALKDTIRRLDRESGVYTLVDRSELFAMQTPQGGDAKLLAAALKNCIDKGVDVTDDVAALELLGARPKIVEGSYRNIKVTTPEDISVAEALLAEGEDE